MSMTLLDVCSFFFQQHWFDYNVDNDDNSDDDGDDDGDGDNSDDDDDDSDTCDGSAASLPELKFYFNKWPKL